MLYYWKMFLWKNGKKDEEYSDYMDAPLFLEDKLDETLDSGEVILTGMPISTKAAFPPKTKFRLERYDAAELKAQGDNAKAQKHWDMIVEHDDVEEYAGCPELCTHRIYLIEASAVAQGMHVDNIALTYKLQDVTLNYRTVQSITDSIKDMGKDFYDAQDKMDTPAIQTNQKMTSVVDEVRAGNVATVFFNNSYRYQWRNCASLMSVKYKYYAGERQRITFDIPTLFAQAAIGTGWVDVCEVRTTTQITRKHYRGNELLGTSVIEKNCGPTSLPDTSPYEYVYAFGKGDTFGSAKDAPQSCYATTIRAFSSQAKGTLGGLVQSIEELDTFDQHLHKSLDRISTADANADGKSILIETDILTDSQMKSGERFEYEIKTVAKGDSNSLPVFYECKCDVGKNTSGYYANNTNGLFGNDYSGNGTGTKVPATSIFVSANFSVQDLSSYEAADRFLASGKQYTCLELLRKALLTCDTRVFDNNSFGLDTLGYPIVIDPFWEKRLGNVKMHETTFEQKNLWEILLQIGYYLHAIPYLEFADDGTDRFKLSFRQLGDTQIKEDRSVKITVFNSRNLSEYFTQYDSYVTNLFSPQSEVEEWGVVKTSDSSYLVSNNTAEIHTKYPIQEIVEFDISYGSNTRSALDMIFEESIYSILTPDEDVRPSKACALFYKLGDTKISGLNYEPPSVHNDAPHALKTILSALFGVDAKSNLQFNDIRYHIKYRTQDSLRLSQVRPNLQDFMKNSAYEVYPHHEQFYGQQDKIVDSERFSANLFGKLIRVGNAVYQRQEYASSGAEKEAGDLVMIGDAPYYVTEIENEYYADVVLQKVTYSKNFNQLSNIVTIPSEPRFYEVSERSQVRREVRIMEFLLLTTKEDTAATLPTFINNDRWQSIIRSLLFADGNYDMPNFAFVRFKGDKKRAHEGTPLNKLFPSTEISRTGNNSARPKDSSDHRDVIVPLVHFPLKNAMVFEWDMDDNFKAGDSIDTSISGTGNTNDDTYYSMQPVRYCDIMGRADLFNFRLFNKTSWTLEQARRLPFAEENDFVPGEAESDFYLPDNLSIALDKDNREALSFNYQINLLQEDETFVTYPNLFGAKGSRLQMCFLNVEASLFDDGVPIMAETIIADNVDYSLLDSSKNAIEIRIPDPQNIDVDAVKSIVLYEKDGASKYTYIARNVANETNKFRSWWICPIFCSG